MINIYALWWVRLWSLLLWSAICGHPFIKNIRNLINGYEKIIKPQNLGMCKRIAYKHLEIFLNEETTWSYQEKLHFDAATRRLIYSTYTWTFRKAWLWLIIEPIIFSISYKQILWWQNRMNPWIKKATLLCLACLPLGTPYETALLLSHLH